MRFYGCKISATRRRSCKNQEVTYKGSETLQNIYPDITYPRKVSRTVHKLNFVINCKKTTNNSENRQGLQTDSQPKNIL